MSLLPKPWEKAEHDADILGQYRERIYYHLSIAGIILISPLFVNNFLQHRYVAGAATFLVVLVFAINAVSMHRRGKPVLPPAVVFFPIILSIALAFGQLGLITIVWTYPSIILIFFIVSRRTANVLGFVTSVIVPSIAYNYGETYHVTLRIFASIVLTIVFINIILKIIIDLQNKLQWQAIIDELTGAYNRRHMENSLEHAMEFQKRYRTRLSLIMFDLDSFKKINDELGHAAGDMVLVGVVEISKRVLRSVDLVFRIGGEEFVILLPETDGQSAYKVAEKLRKAIAGANLLGDRKISGSFGVGEIVPGESTDDLLRRCDAALYKCKEQGGNMTFTTEAREHKSEANQGEYAAHGAK
jgi:diguanylate cyclase (GGDEF)-like protein